MFKNFKLTKFDWFLLLSVLFIGAAQASGGGTGMPWESGLETVQQSLTGPVAKAICLIGIVGSGIMLIWGGEVSGFLKTVVYVILVICLIMGANIILNMASGSSALLPESFSLEQAEALKQLQNLY